MTRGGMRALAFGSATFFAVLTLGVAATPGQRAEAEAPPAAPAAAFARIGDMNEKAAEIDAARRRAGHAL
ncbi:MAG: hypothetical protein AB7O91_11440 [Sphingomonas sp.]